jgi:hypothetical protein
MAHMHQGVPRTSTQDGNVVTVTYDVLAAYPKGQVIKVTTSYRPGHGYVVTVYIKGKDPRTCPYPEGWWGAVVTDLTGTLAQHGCPVFDIDEPKPAFG